VSSQQLAGSLANSLASLCSGKDCPVIDQIIAARDAALAEIDAADSLDSVTALDASLLGKRGPLAQLKTQLGGLATVDEKRAAGQAVNEAIDVVTASVARRIADLEEQALDARVEAERLDLTEFIGRSRRGHAHLVTQAWERLEDVFIGLGFQIAEGPEVETDWHNFEALNMGEGHPARGEFDTLFVDYTPPGGTPGHTVLRTHTSPVQIRTMLTETPPIYIVAPGRVFRRDTPDATHMPVFHQIEGLVIDRNITLADLAGTIEAFTKAFFGVGFSSRLRPSYFPFTEPSAEFDVQRPDGSWLELGGCGMVHPNVLRAGGIDPEEWSGFAFGFGIDRMAVMRHQVADIRDMYANDLRFVEQF
jgi:phenylalanyl-tRNA synthetase alpha chain